MHAQIHLIILTETKYPIGIANIINIKLNNKINNSILVLILEKFLIVSEFKLECLISCCFRFTFIIDFLFFKKIKLPMMLKRFKVIISNHNNFK